MMTEVKILCRDDGFFVRIADGAEVHEERFDLAQHAVSWAESVRLGLVGPTAGLKIVVNTTR